MTKLPKLKVEGLGWEVFAETHDFEKAKYFPFGQNVVVVVEENVIGSYEDLVRLAEQPEYRNREFLRVKLLEIVAGG